MDRRLVALFCFFWLVGCNSSSTAPATPTQPTPTPPAIPTATLATSTSTPAPDVEATEHAIASTAIVEAVVATQQPRVHNTYPSPDGKWLAEVIIYDCVKVDPRPDADANAYEQLLLTDPGRGEEELIDAQLQNCGGLGAAGLDGLFWSPNSRYFYYTDAREGIPDGCGGYWYQPILRLDINTLRTELLGGGTFSPDGTKVATWQGKELVVWDLNEDNEIGRTSPHVVNTETGTGAIVWAPDSQALVYVQPESYCPVSGDSIVVHIDVSTLEQTVLLESESPTFGGARWDTPGELTLIDENGNEWVYTFADQELKPAP